MSFDCPDIDYDPIEDESDLGFAVLGNVDGFRDALEEPPPEFWDEMFSQPEVLSLIHI